jgi:hypothetical protein
MSNVSACGTRETVRVRVTAVMVEPAGSAVAGSNWIRPRRISTGLLGPFEAVLPPKKYSPAPLLRLPVGSSYSVLSLTGARSATSWALEAVEATPRARDTILG